MIIHCPASTMYKNLPLKKVEGVVVVLHSRLLFHLSETPKQLRKKLTAYTNSVTAYCSEKETINGLVTDIIVSI